MLWRPRRSILDENNLLALVLLYEDLLWFEYSLPTMWFASCCGHFRVSFHLEHRFGETVSPSPIFEQWYFIKSYFIPAQECTRFCVLVGCPEWSGLEIHFVLLFPTPPVRSYYSTWFFEKIFWKLIFTVVRKKVCGLYCPAVPVRDHRKCSWHLLHLRPCRNRKTHTYRAASSGYRAREFPIYER